MPEDTMSSPLFNEIDESYHRLQPAAAPGCACDKS
jgi:hypothetical protein